MSRNIQQATKYIQEGKLVAFPTETVYGLGADATNEEACKQIFAVKGRPTINPLIVHVASFEQALAIGEFNEDAVLLAHNFWPGPLTMVVGLKIPTKIASSVLTGLNTIAIRCPAHKVALELIKYSGKPIAAPSANLSGYVSSTNSQHVVADFADEVLVLESEESCIYGLESTIIDLTSDELTILRYGFITPEAIEQVLNKKVQPAPSLMQIKAPGMLEKHYSPRLPVRLNVENALPEEAVLNFGASELCGKVTLNLSHAGNLAEAASNLYAYLRLLDNTKDISGIAVAAVPNIGIGLAINDRLRRAATI